MQPESIDLTRAANAAWNVHDYWVSRAAAMMVDAVTTPHYPTISRDLAIDYARTAVAARLEARQCAREAATLKAAS